MTIYPKSFSEYLDAVDKTLIADKLRNDGGLMLIEVKSGTNRNTTGLRVFEEHYKPKHLVRISPRNLIVNCNFTNIPLYSNFAIQNVL